MANAWQVLGFYESRDLVAKRYLKRHERVLSAARAYPIISNFVQGREYFASARVAAELVRPLLLYYGVLSLARGLILLKKTTAKEENLSPAHGIQPRSWGSTLSKGIEHIPDLSVSFAAGTFSEFSEVTQNNERTVVLRAPFPNRLLIKQSGSVVLNHHVVLLRDMLARIPELSSIYEATFGTEGSCARGIVFVLSDDTQTDVSILESEFGLLSASAIRRTYGVSDTTNITEADHHNFAGNVKNNSFRLIHSNREELLAQLPIVRNDDSGNMFLVPALDGSLVLSRLSMLYLVSYVLGMLARYYPSKWLSLLKRDKGDLSLPIIRTVLSQIEADVPVLLVQELEAD
jgi:hypothetical protein